ATQNPIEHEGTYPLPEAQSDRFMLKVKVGYPGRAEEKEILRRAGLQSLPELTPRASHEDVLEAREALADVYVDDKIQEYVLDIVSATRRPRDYGLQLDTLLAFGASPRATLFLVRGAQALAVLEGRPYVPGDEVRDIDWNVTARLGSPYVKRFVEERELTVLLVVDVSRSMRFGTAGAEKRELAAELCAVLGFAAISNNDRVGLVLAG